MLPDPYVYTLRKPVIVGGETVTQVTLTEPTVDQIDRAQRRGDTPMTTMIILVGYVSGVSEAAIRKMGQRDWNAMSDYILGFSGGGLADGAVESPTSPSSSDGAPATAQG